MQNEITELRNQVRALKRIVYGIGFLLVAGVVLAATSLQTVPDVIQAKCFEVLSDEGKAVAELKAYKNGGMLIIYNSAGKRVSTITPAFLGDGTITVNDKHGMPKVWITAAKSDGLLTIFDKEKNMFVFPAQKKPE